MSCPTPSFTLPPWFQEPDQALSPHAQLRPGKEETSLLPATKDTMWVFPQMGPVWSLCWVVAGQEGP